MSTTNH
jgi:hypothetical protein